MIESVLYNSKYFPAIMTKYSGTPVRVIINFQWHPSNTDTPTITKKKFPIIFNMYSFGDFERISMYSSKLLIQLKGSFQPFTFEPYFFKKAKTFFLLVLTFS